MRRPRASVLDEVWRGLDGVEALSGPHGGPLRRTVKLILDPLVIRPVQHPACAGAVLTADGATLLATRVHAAADVLRATAAWFTLLKQVRRALRITEGNAQDLYFQRCFELATEYGHPHPTRDRPRAEATLREIHSFAAGRTTQALKDHLSDAGVTARLAELVETAWTRRPPPRPRDPSHSGQLLDLLTAAADRTSPHRGEGARLLAAMIAANAGTHTGIALWYSEFGVTARELGLTAHPLPARPALGASAATAALALPFDRTIYERVFTVLQASTERAELPPIPDLVTDEIARSCAPWALLDESLRAAAAAGTELGLGLEPIDRPGGAAAESAAHRVVNSRWRREAYVLQARRLAVHLVPDAAEDRDPLTVVAAELRAPWRPYLRRLWVRLHGRDVRGLPVHEPEELWDLLDGVARSVILDHRTRVKNALSAAAAAPAVDTTEPRAS
ncbi:hypothetical protein CJ469_03069 [Nocardia farcinica]|uniref:hypothetical protein n=2 Tax=Nocardia farcinica TaxID=37329 RepID=UPI000BF7B45F|nr:hypothetical protein [Nocardia farcinica]PFX01754.1 hypothetical protein CJ469_03069 [Nocardia farcinica]PFX09013.1 hypothetical protein CJ468_02260 [Nocardia farcinica]